MLIRTWENNVKSHVQNHRTMGNPSSNEKNWKFCITWWMDEGKTHMTSHEEPPCFRTLSSRNSSFATCGVRNFDLAKGQSRRAWQDGRMAGWQDGGTPWNTMIFSLTSWFHLINYLTDFNIFLKYNLFQNLSIFQHRPLVVVSAQGYFTGRAPTADEFQMHWSQMDLLRVGRVSKKDLAKWLKNGAPQVGVLHPKMVIFLVDWPWILVIYLWIFLWASWLFDVWGCDVDTSFLYLMLLMLLCGGSTCVG
jgi:hypothetical protein